MDPKLKEYLGSGKYLPDFIEDFHDQKKLFKRLNEIVEKREDRYTNDMNWISAQVYTVDVFLWFMAAHGYTLQKSRKKVPFFNIYHDLNEFEKRQREASADILSQILGGGRIAMSESLLRQLLFDCAVELLHGSEGLSNEQIANKLLNIVEALDKAES